MYPNFVLSVVVTEMIKTDKIHFKLLTLTQLRLLFIYLSFSILLLGYHIPWAKNKGQVLFILVFIGPTMMLIIPWLSNNVDLMELCGVIYNY